MLNFFKLIKATCHLTQVAFLLLGQNRFFNRHCFICIHPIIYFSLTRNSANIRSRSNSALNSASEGKIAFNGFFFVKTTGFRIFNPHNKSVMCPCQFAPQGGANWISITFKIYVLQICIAQLCMKQLEYAVLGGALRLPDFTHL